MSELSELALRVQAGVATRQELEGLSETNLLAIKSDNGVMHRRFVAEKGHGVNEKEGTTEGVPVSTESRDRQGDVVSQRGWSIKDFRGNPIILFGHGQSAFTGSDNSDDLPVALATKVRRGQSASGKRALLGDEKFHTDDMLTPLGQLVKRHVMKGALPGRSVGFIPTDVYRPENEEEREKLDIGEQGVLIKAAELLEWSVVPIPANAEALQERALKSFRAVQEACKGEFSEEVLKSFEDLFPLTEQDFLTNERKRKRSRISLSEIKADFEILFEQRSPLLPLEETYIPLPTATLGTSTGAPPLFDQAERIVAAVEQFTASCNKLVAALEKSVAVTKVPDAKAASGGNNGEPKKTDLYEQMEKDIERRFSTAQED